VINSNIGPISRCFRDMVIFRDMASFPSKNARFSYFLDSIPNLKMFPLHCILLIWYTESLDTMLITRAKVFLYNLRLSYNTSRYWRTIDRRQATDDNRAIDAYSYSCSASKIKPRLFVITEQIGLLSNFRILTLPHLAVIRKFALKTRN